MAQAAETPGLQQHLAGRAPLLDLRLSLPPGAARHLPGGAHHAASGWAPRSSWCRSTTRWWSPRRSPRSRCWPRAARHRARPRLPALRVRALRARARERARPLGGVGRHHPEGARGRPFSYEGKLYRIPETTIFPQLERTAAADLDHRPEPRLGRGRGAPRLQRAHRRLRRPGRAHGRVPQALRPGGGRGEAAAAASRRRAARGLRDHETTRTRARPPRRRAGTCG